MDLFKRFCKQANYFPEVELEILIDDRNFDGKEGQIYYWYLGKLVAIETFKSVKHRLVFTKEGKKLLIREVLKQIKNDLL